MDFGSGSILVVSFGGFEFLSTTYFGLVSTFSAHTRKPAIDILHGYLISIVWNTPGYFLRLSLAAARVIFPRKSMLDTRRPESILL